MVEHPTGHAPGQEEAIKQWRPRVAEPFSALGRSTVDLVNNMGAAAIFLFLAVLMIFRPKQVPKIAQQVYYIGARSTTIIMLVGLFTGMVLGLQSYHALVKFGAEGSLGTLVVLSLVRELGPVLTAIMITARAGSAITAEIGIQRISEQIDALDTMRIPDKPPNRRRLDQLSVADGAVRSHRHSGRLPLRGSALGSERGHLLLPSPS